jgi:carotenoid cleavage dioxygenase
MVDQHARQHPLARHALLERRAFLQGVAAMAAAGSAGTLLGACSSSDASRPLAGGAAATTTSTTLVPVVYTDDQPYWMQGNYAPVSEETEAFDLEVTGSLPAALTGLYVRNGSNPAGEASSHWFLGDGMVHGVRLDGGKASWYRNRYVQTPLYTNRQGFLGGGPPGGAGNQSNVSVFAHGDKLLSSGEVGFPYELAPADLATVGVHDFGGALKTAMTAHPKIDPETGRMHFFGYGFTPPFLTYHVAEADGTLVSSEEVAVPGSTMIHDFAVTDRHVVFWDLPVIFDLDIALAAINGGTGGGFPFRWDESYGARVGVMPLGGPTSAIRWVDIEPCYVFHGVNAHASGDDVVIDVCRLPSMFRAEPDRRPNAIHRWTVGTGGDALTFADEVLSDEQMDLPAIDRRRMGRAHENTWFLHVEQTNDGFGDFTGISRRDTRTGAMDRYDAGDRIRMNEGTFVPDGDGAGDGEGWLLAYGWDRARGASDLMVFEALDMAKGPIAQVHLPVRVPYGFHGWWLPDAV